VESQPVSQGPRAKIGEFLKKAGKLRDQKEVLAGLTGPAPKTHPNLGPLEVFKGPDGEFWVSKASGEIVTFSPPKRFTATEAQQYAKAFLERHVPDFAKRNFQQVSAEMQDPLWKEEWVEKPRPPKEVSVFPNWAVIQVNLDTRSVHYWNASNIRLVRTAPPKIDQEGAKKVIRGGFPEAEILKLELMEHTTDGGKTSVTIWNASFRPAADKDSPVKLLSINADTGKVVP